MSAHLRTPLLLLLAALATACGVEFEGPGVQTDDAPSEVAPTPAPPSGHDDPEPGRDMPDEPNEPDEEPDPQPAAEPPAEEETDEEPPPPDPPAEDLGPAWVPDAHEPNESCPAGAPLGTGEQLGLTLQQGNADWYRVTVCPDGAFTARFEFQALDGRIDEFLRDDTGTDYGGATIDGGGAGATTTGMEQGGRTYCLGYELTGPDLHYTLTVEISGCP